MLATLQSRRLRRASSCGLGLSKSGEHITDLQRGDHDILLRSQHRLEVTDKINKVYFKHLIDNINGYRDLSEIVITNAGMGGITFQYICSRLKRHTTAKLVLFDVHGNELGDESLEHIQLLGEFHLSALTQINFSWNKITTIPESFGATFAEFIQKKDLSLQLDFNTGLTSVYRLFNIQCLRSCSLAGTGLSNDQIEEMVPLLKSHPNLTSLDLSYNMIGNEGIRQIAHCIIEKNQTLTKLCLLGNPFGAPGGEALNVSLQQNRTIKEFTPAIIFEGKTHNKNLLEFF